MGPKVYIGGKLHEKASAAISVFDHGFLFGDGVVEEMRAYSGRIFRLAEHVDRLFASARSIRLAIPLDRPAMARAVRETLAANGLDDAYVRIIVTRGAGSLDLDPRKTTDPQVVIVTDQVSVFPEELYEYGLKLATVERPCDAPGLRQLRIHSLSALSDVLARIEARAAGCLDALLVDHREEVAGCIAGDLFLVKSGTISVPPIESGGRDEVHRRSLLDLAKAMGCGIVEGPLARYDVYEADECFLSGTAAGLIPVVECDGRAIGTGRPGPITRELRRRFEALVRADG